MGSKLRRVFSMYIPRLRSLRITPGFYPGVTRPVRNIPRPRFSSIIPGFYPGSAAGYYFQGPARPKRLLPCGNLPFSISFNAVTLQFANWPSNKYGGGSHYPRPVFLFNSVTLQFVNQFSLRAALQFASRFFHWEQRFNSLTNSRRGVKKGNKELKESKGWIDRNITGRVACKQMVPKDERRSIGEGKKEREGRV